ncbi:uncharacterized protein LOC108203864 [Daucus carota subsp. sativus]|uniref:uncharacterized protein LOC108203864 n=1 Tax=Daucus carota subsp. sativus TaxID=79200 RepID=UPI003082DFAA
MDRSWMDKPDKLSVEYANGINEFITVAQNCVDSGGKVLCPCCRCVNKESQKLNVIKLHLLTSGFQNTYKIWYYHGEQRDNMEEDDLVAGEDVSGEQDDLATGLNDALKVSTEQYCSREACHIQPLKLDKEKNSHHGLRKRYPKCKSKTQLVSMRICTLYLKVH